MLDRRNFVLGGLVTGVALLTPKANVAHTQEGTPEATGSDPYVFGNAFDLLPRADDEVAVVSSGQPIDMGLIAVPVVIHNGTDEAVGINNVQAVVRDASGTMVAVGEIESAAPYRVEAGAYALAKVEFDSDVEIPSDATYEFTVETEESDDDTYLNINVTEAVVTGDKVLGLVANNEAMDVIEPIMALAMTFDDAGNLVGCGYEFLTASEVPVGGSAPFEIDMYGDVTDLYLVAARGWAF